ncbi:General substrate transporter [Niveomyces insectorum RCEF 264]|uniref:General substrate transporter n=1 Tax=Niveomyces insectorum RCEF 264 TaxID=1081102 RepID=A0A167T943_9HYPO|nr:General substrate transporter [Niveomyces insectorum RCEF 264]
MAKHKQTAYSVLIMAFVALGSLSFGYSNTCSGPLLGQPSFREYFNLDTNTDAMTGAMNGIYTAGGFVGALVSSWLADRVGRKKSIFIGTVLATIGGALQAGSVKWAMFLVFRCVNGLGVGMLLSLVPLYQSEVSPPHNRGLMVGFHGIMVTVGYFGSTWIGFGFYFVTGLNGAEWRIPLAIQAIPPLLCGAGIVYLPESPRWLISQDRDEEALAVVRKLHHDPTNPDDTFAFREYQQIRQQFEIDRRNEVSLYQLFAKPSYRKRMIIGFIVLFGAQTTGTTVIANYGPELYSKLGFNSTKQLLLGAVYATIALCGNFFNAFTVDHVGRVKALKMGWIGDLLSLVGECVALSVFERTGSRQSAIASVVFLFTHIACFAFNVDVTTYVYTSEIFPSNIRSKGMAWSICSYFASLIIYLQVGPTAFNTIGWKFYLVFLIALFCFIVPLFFYFPETKGQSLEEISRLFGDEATNISLDGPGTTDEKLAVSGGIQTVEAAEEEREHQD